MYIVYPILQLGQIGSLLIETEEILYDNGQGLYSNRTYVGEILLEIFTTNTFHLIPNKSIFKARNNTNNI